MAEPLHFRQPMRDVQHRAAVVREPAQRDEELLGFLRGEHRGRLVHDQQARFLEEAAHDLDALALPDGQVRDQGGRLQRQAVLRRDLCDARAQRPAGRTGRGAARARCSPPRRAPRTAKSAGTPCRSPAAGRRRGFATRHRFAAPAQAPFRGLERAVDDLDERGLAGAVLAKQRVDLPPGAGAGSRCRWAVKSPKRFTTSSASSRYSPVSGRRPIHPGRRLAHCTAPAARADTRRLVHFKPATLRPSNQPVRPGTFSITMRALHSDGAKPRTATPLSSAQRPYEQVILTNTGQIRIDST